MYKYILGLVIVIILTYITWMAYIKIECSNTKTHDRWKKDVGYAILHKKYRMTKQASHLFPIKDLPEGFKFPIVLKPVDGGRGDDVYTDINTNEELYQISKKLLSKFDKIVLENQIIGMRECRVLIHKKLNHISITERLPITVTGDGKNNIFQLVAILDNKNKKEKNKYNDFHKTIIDERIVNPINIPKKNEVVLINNRKNSSLGGDIRFINIKDVHPDNIKLFYSMLRDIDSTFNGLDILFYDLSISHKKSHILLLETNFCPGWNEKRIFSPEFKSARQSFYLYAGISAVIYSILYKTYL
jgi:D-alanine-D-alanine ligase-like ATP-grasp enzyme